jgi:hypothetical protein
MARQLQIDRDQFAQPIDVIRFVNQCQNNAFIFPAGKGGFRVGLSGGYRVKARQEDWSFTDRQPQSFIR